MTTKPKNWFQKLLWSLFEAAFGKVTDQLPPEPAPAPAPTPEPAPVPEQPAPTPAPEPTPTPEPTGPRITKIKHGGKWDVNIYTSGCDDWKIKHGNKDTQGELFIGKVFVDAMRPDQMRGAKKELNNAFGVGQHSLNVNKGDIVTVVIKSFDGRKTEPFEWAWPFEST